jgi:hypothetical protein
MTTPEPASMMLFGTELMLIGGAIRSRRGRWEPASNEA